MNCSRSRKINKRVNTKGYADYNGFLGGERGGGRESLSIDWNLSAFASRFLVRTIINPKKETKRAFRIYRQ